jgi:hypothetical protein
MQTLNTVVIIPNHLENGALRAWTHYSNLYVHRRVGSAGSSSNGSNLRVMTDQKFSLFNIRWR